MPFPSSLHSDIDQAVQGSIKEFIEKRNSGLPRAVVLATTSDTEIVNSVAGFEQFRDDLEAAPKVTDESLFPLWSSTKLVTAIAAMQLVEQGQISLNDDASKYVKELKDLKVFKGFNEKGEPQLEENTHVCTVENLITHTAGKLAFYFRFFSSVELRLDSLSLSRVFLGFKYQYDPVYDKIQAHFGLTSIYDENSTRVSVFTPFFRTNLLRTESAFSASRVEAITHEITIPTPSRYRFQLRNCKRLVGSRRGRCQWTSFRGIPTEEHLRVSPDPIL